MKTFKIEVIVEGADYMYASGAAAIVSNAIDAYPNALIKEVNHSCCAFEMPEPDQEEKDRAEREALREAKRVTALMEASALTRTLLSHRLKFDVEYEAESVIIETHENQIFPAGLPNVQNRSGRYMQWVWTW